jgi:hypothetical protein
VRARQEVHFRHGTAEDAAPEAGLPLPEAEIGVERSRVHDPVSTISSGVRLGGGEVTRVECVWNGGHAARVDLGEGVEYPSTSLLGVHHHCVGTREHTTHLSQLEPPVQSARVEEHVVECPGILEIEDEGPLQSATDRQRGVGDEKRRERAVEDVRGAPDGHGGVDGGGGPPPFPRRLDAQPPSQARGDERGLRGLQTLNASRDSPVHQRSVARRPPEIVARTAPREDCGVVPDIRKASRELEVSLYGCAAERGEVRRDEKDVLHWPAATSTSSKVTSA